MLGKKLLCRLAGVIPSPIMDYKEVLRGVGQDHLQELLVTVRSKPALDALIEHTSGEILNGAKHFVPFALATGFDLGLLTTPRPRVAQRAPLGKTGLILEQDQAVAPRGGAQNHGPFLLEPLLAPCSVEMIRHKTGLLKRKPQVMQQRTHILAVVEHAELPPDQHPDEHGGPTGRLAAYDLRPSLQQLHQAFFLAWSQLWPAPTAMVIGQTVYPMQQERLTPFADVGDADAPVCMWDFSGDGGTDKVDQQGDPRTYPI